MLGIILFSFFSPDVKNTTSKTTPTSAVITHTVSKKEFPQNPSSEYAKSIREAELRNSDFFTHEKKVGALLSKLPYTATSLTLMYDYKKNTYVATITLAKKEAGDQELTEFLKENGVERSWIRELVIIYK
jgi:hypothetical protein